MSSLKKIFFSVFLLTLATLGSFSIKHAVAGTSQNALGWMWGGTDATSFGNTAVGWISANSRDCDVDSNGLVDVLACTPGTIADYGVAIPATGALSGYAWSENYGWISFQAADVSGCPIGTCSSQRIGNNLTGWLRILSIRDAGVNSGGWSGFVSLDSTTTGSALPYGVTLAGTTLSGYGWSDELGWIDFSGVTISAPAPTVSLLINGAHSNISLFNGSTYTISWSVADATSCTASSSDDFGGNIPTTPPTGTFIVTADRDSTPTLSCTGLGGTTSDSLFADISCTSSTGAYGSCDCPTETKSRHIVEASCNEYDESTACSSVEKNACRDFNWKEVAP